jgi:uncharacterized membrane protein
MSELVVFAFPTETGAREMGETVKSLQKQELIKLADAAYVDRRQDGKVKVKQAQSLVGAGALGGAFWGMLIGLLFFMPWLGLAIGAVTGAIAGKFSDIGIDDDFIKEVGSSIEPGQSALFLLIADWTEDKALAELSKFDAKVLRTSLTEEDEEKLRAAFSAHDEEEETSDA